jgi:hypothetical protein
VTEHTEIKTTEVKEVSAADLQSPATKRVPQYRRDVFPANIVLSASDLAGLCRILSEANERAKTIELINLVLSKFESAEQARDRVNDLVQFEYNYVATNGDSVRGLGIPKVDDQSFPEELRTFFVSNASYTRRAINTEALNVVDAFFSFAKPSLKIDLQTLPSNPTENRSVINVYGRDEDWVVSTTNRIQEFLRKKKSFRPVIHGSGAYDYFIHLAFLPAFLWFFFKRSDLIGSWLAGLPIFLNVLLAIYVFFILLLFARFIFQYFRWLFPPTEYYKTSRVGAYTHRVVFGMVCSGVMINAVYDLTKGIVSTLFGH